jgi:lysophospholipase L1-like esterase
MPNVSKFGAQTDNSVVQGTVTDRAMVIPDIPPQGLMSVGPRVTPHFVKPSLWSALTTYHFFDAVHDAAGASYVAIKPEVPAGTELADEEYWFLWADPNSQFADLSELVKTFDGRISQNTTNIATKAPIKHSSEETDYGVGDEVNYGHVRLATETTPTTSGADDGIAVTPKFLKTFTSKVTEFNNTTVVAFGDSITHGYGLANPTTDCWPAKLCAQLNSTLYNFAIDGANFSSKEIANQVTTAGNDGRFDNSSVGLVLFGAGINDHGQSQTAIEKGINAAVSNAKKFFPNAKIYALPVLCASKPLDAINQGDNQYLHSISAQYVINAFCSIGDIYTFSRAYTWLQTDDKYAQDNVHPNALGAEIIAYNVLSSIRGADQNCRLRYRDLSYADEIKTKISDTSNAQFYTDGITWTAYGVMKFTSIEGIGSTTAMITLPDTCLFRKNQVRVFDLVNFDNDGILIYVIDGIARFWNITANKQLRTGTDYYWYISGMVGM